MRIITFFFLFIFGLNFSQTTQETINWINKMSYNRHYVISAEKTKVTLLNTRHVQGWATISTYEIINPSTVSKIFYSIDKDGWGLINIVFNKQTSIPTKTVIKYENNTNKDEEKIEEKIQNSILISLPSGNKTESINKAYLHLFKKFNTKIKEGDTF